MNNNNEINVKPATTTSSSTTRTTTKKEQQQNKVILLDLQHDIEERPVTEQILNQYFMEKMNVNNEQANKLLDNSLIYTIRPDYCVCSGTARNYFAKCKKHLGSNGGVVVAAITDAAAYVQSEEKELK